MSRREEQRLPRAVAPLAPGEDRPFNEVEVTMDDRRTAVAQYDWRLPGDYNDDCTVNVLDLLFVRNRLQTKCSE